MFGRYLFDVFELERPDGPSADKASTAQPAGGGGTGAAAPSGSDPAVPFFLPLVSPRQFSVTNPQPSQGLPAGRATRRLIGMDELISPREGGGYPTPQAPPPRMTMGARLHEREAQMRVLLPPPRRRVWVVSLPSQ